MLPALTATDLAIIACVLPTANAQIAYEATKMPCPLCGNKSLVIGGMVTRFARCACFACGFVSKAWRGEAEEAP